MTADARDDVDAVSTALAGVDSGWRQPERTAVEVRISPGCLSSGQTRKLVMKSICNTREAGVLSKSTTYRWSLMIPTQIV
jgi:hypothetical protein